MATACRRSRRAARGLLETPAPSAEVTIFAKHMPKLYALAVTVGAIESARDAVGSTEEVMTILEI